MRKYLISTLLFASILFVVAYAFAASDERSGPPGAELNYKGTKTRGITVSGHTIPAVSRSSSHRFVPGSVLVRFKPGTKAADKSMGRQMIRAKMLRTYSLVPNLEYLLIDIPGLEVKDAIEILERLPFVEYAQPNHIISISQTIPDDANFSEQWALHNIGQSSGWDSFWGLGPLWGPGTIDADLDAPEAWDTLTSSSQPVAIIDTGIAYDHPDLDGNIWINIHEIPDNGIDDDGNGYVDDVYGWDFVNDDNDPYDGHGHGSHVAGIVAAEGNNGVSVPEYDLGTTGVLWQGKLMALKALDDAGQGWLTDAIDALQYAVDMGARISNNSWGYYDEQELGHQALYDAIAAVRTNNHLVMAAAGNGNSWGLGVDTDTTPHYPSGFDLDNIISVAATDYNDNLAVFSNYGFESVDLAAPGVQIFSTWKWTNGYPDYSWLDGTSMATPHVSGVAAMIIEQHPDWSYAQVRNRILDTVRPVYELSTKTVTGGIINAANAVAIATAYPTANFSYITDGQTVTFTDLSNDSDGDIMIWAWNFGDGNSSSLEDPAHTYADPGTYVVSLTVTDNDGASDTASQEVTVAAPSNEPPVAFFTYQCTGLTCSFFGSGSDEDGNIVQYQWDFGDGKASSEQNPVYSYTNSGEYSVTLIVTDDEGATGTASQQVSLNDLSGINAPADLVAIVEANTVHLQWRDTSGNEDGFVVERAEKIRGKYLFERLGETGEGYDGTAGYSDMNISPGNYKYRVYAYNATISSDFSNEVLVKVEEISSFCGDGYCHPEEYCSCPDDCGTPLSSETNCSDGIDDDCDGFIDCLDADCTNELSCGDCGTKGSPCATAADCCSGDCRGIKCK